MPSDSEDQTDNWSNLKSITTFDRYNKSLRPLEISTQIIGGSFIETVAGKATTPISLLVESLVQQLCSMLDPDPVSSSKLYNTICEQLHQMNLIDKTYAMGEFELMRSQYQRALYQLVSVARGQDLPPTIQSVWPLTQPIGMDWSRYHREFDEIAYIAGGGFGKVYKAKHRLDGIEYAVKKITIKSTNINRVLSHLAEVKTLAGLHHVNVVPYKAAWLEPLFTDPNETKCIKTADDSNDEDVTDSNSFTVDTSNKSESIQEESSDFIQFEQSSTNDQESCNSKAQKAICKYKNQRLSFNDTQPHLRLKWANLYIQMALCQLTLREWLDTRNKSESFEQFYREYLKTQVHNSREKRIVQNQHDRWRKSSDSSIDESINNLQHLDIVMNIFNQLLNGLSYIQLKGIIHHDIKPSNIFVSVENDGKLCVQLGDFGLACPLQDEHTKVVVGTPTYAAPEQLNGYCNPKSDIYSLGIILVELLLRFNTDMERIKTIESCRKGQVPQQIEEPYETLVKRMLQPHTKRPNISQIIDIIDNTSSDTISTDIYKRLHELNVEVDTLRTKIEQHEYIDSEIISKNSEIQIKNEVIRSKDVEIARLQTTIVEMETKTSELISKDEEINRLKELLSLCQKNSENNSS